MAKLVPQKVTNGKREVTTDRLSLAPLAFETAVGAALATGKAPPLPKKGAGKASKADKAAWAKIDKGPKPPKGKK